MEFGERIIIIGSSGAGKSTLARELGALLGLEVIHLDAYFWQPGWVSLPKEAWHPLVEELTRRERWVMDGNYGGTMEIRLQAADTIIFLDLPRWLCLWRILQRRVMYHGKTRPDIGPGCPEKIDWEFFLWVWRDFPRHNRPGILQRLAQAGEEKRVIILRSPRDVRRLLTSVEQRTQTIA